MVNYSFKKYYFNVILLSILLVISLSSISIAQAKVNIQMGCSSSAGSLFAIASAWSQIINQNSSFVRSTAVSTGGGVENSRLVRAGEIEIGTNAGPLVVEYMNTDDSYKDTRALWGYYYGGAQYLVLENSGIKTISDMKGKRVSIGAPGSMGAEHVEEVLEYHGLYADKDYKMETLIGSSATSALKDGNLDVFAFCAPIPVSYAQDIASQRTIRLIPIELEAAQRYIDKNPGYFLDKFPNNAYSNQKNEIDIDGISWTQYWFTSAKVDDEVIYETVKWLFENLEQFHDTHSSITQVNLENALNGIYIPLHAGAIRYYQEKGISIPEYLLPPEIF